MPDVPVIYRALFQKDLFFTWVSRLLQVHDKLLEVHALDKLKLATRVLITGSLQNPKEITEGSCMGRDG